MITARTIAATMLLATSARAGGFTISEIGVGRTGMGAVVGNPDEPSSAAHNPAGLAQLGGVRLYFSGGLAMIDTQFRLAAWPGSEQFLGDPEPDGYYRPIEPDRALAVVPMIATTFQLTDRWFAGLSMYVTNATGSSFDENAVTRYHAISGSLIAPIATVSVAHQLTPKLALGASVGVVNVRVQGRRYIYPVRDGVDVSPIIGTRAELVASGSDLAVSWNAGVRVTPIPRLAIGAAITGRVDAEIEGPATLRYGPDGREMEELFGRQSTSFMLPWVFQAGINAGASRNLDVALEGRYWLYRQLEEQRTELKGLLFVRELVTEKDFKDSYQVSGGVRVHDLAAVPGLELMAGLHYDRSPAPTRTLSLDQPSFDNIGVHAGVRMSFGRYRVGLSYLFLDYLVPTVDDSVTSPPSNFSGSGRLHLITASFEAIVHRGSLW